MSKMTYKITCAYVAMTPGCEDIPHKPSHIISKQTVTHQSQSKFWEGVDTSEIHIKNKWICSYFLKMTLHSQKKQLGMGMTPGCKDIPQKPLHLKGLIHKNLQNAAEGGMAPRPMIPTAVICVSTWYVPSPQLLYPLGRIYRVFAGFY